MNIKNNKSIKSARRYIITYIFGILTILIGQFIANYINRPQINIEVRSLIIREIQKNDWRTEINLQLENSGKSNTTVEIKNIFLYYPKYSKRPFSIKINKYFKINEKSILVESINSTFPSVFDSVLYTLPKLEKIEVEYKTIETLNYKLASVDSSDIRYSFCYGVEYHGPEKLTKSIIDTLENNISLEVKPFYIKYKGKSYLNKIYPSNAIVKYKIQNEMIYLEYSIRGGDLSLNQISPLIVPFIIFPHLDLKDKIIEPNKTTIKLLIENRNSDDINYDEFAVDIKNSENMIFYIF